MSQQESDHYSIVPAHLDYLSIYCPELGTSEQNETDQLLFHYAHPVKSRRRKEQSIHEQEREDAEAAHKSMRQIGLAQGMVNFARTFNGGKDVDSIETETHRIVLKELEKGWWILASIHLTGLPSTKQSAVYEHSSREVSPPILLISQLQRAYRIFLLHQGQNLRELYSRLKYSKFCTLVDRYWTEFSRNWDVLLHANPATEVYDGTKLAAGGELGAGEGDEEYGSLEKEALEAMIRNTDGLVDLVLSRCDTQESQGTTRLLAGPQTPQDRRPNPSKHLELANGVHFTGCGALSKSSVRVVSEWINLVHAHGANAYGIVSNPVSERVIRTKDDRKTEKAKITPSAPDIPPTPESDMEASLASIEPIPQEPEEKQDQPNRRPIIPPPLVVSIDDSLQKATKSVESRGVGMEKVKDKKRFQGEADQKKDTEDTYTWTDVFTFGYGSSWMKNDPRSGRPKLQSRTDTTKSRREYHHRRASGTSTSSGAHKSHEGDKVSEEISDNSRDRGQFLVGLLGDLDQESEMNPSETVAPTSPASSDMHKRLVARTVHVQINTTSEARSPGTELRDYLTVANKTNEFEPKRLRVVVFEQYPFIFTLLFKQETPSLAIPSFYSDLQHKLQKLHDKLVEVTCPSRIAKHIASLSPTPSAFPSSADATPASESGPSLYHLIYDPFKLTTRSTLPSVPSPNPGPNSPPAPPASSSKSTRSPSQTANISRIDALTIHTQALAFIADTRTPSTTSERSAKTSRAWWVNWLRIPTKTTSTRDSPFNIFGADGGDNNSSTSTTATDLVAGQGRRRRGSNESDFLPRPIVAQDSHQAQGHNHKSKQEPQTSGPPTIESYANTLASASEVSKTPPHREALVVWRSTSSRSGSGVGDTLFHESGAGRRGREGEGQKGMTAATLGAMGLGNLGLGARSFGSMLGVSGGGREGGSSRRGDRRGRSPGNGGDDDTGSVAEGLTGGVDVRAYIDTLLPLSN